MSQGRVPPLLHPDLHPADDDQELPVLRVQLIYQRLRGEGWAGAYVQGIWDSDGLRVYHLRADV